MKKPNITLTLMLAVLIIFSCSAQNRQSSRGWEVLGQRIVNISADHDEITVGTNMGTFRKLRFKVTQAPIYVKNIKVTYGNGSSENHVINMAFKRGYLTKALDLTGNNRIIRKIAFNYSSVNVGKGKAKIIAFGKH